MWPEIHSEPQLWLSDLMINLICPCLCRKRPFIEGHIVVFACWAAVFQCSELSCNKAEVFPNWFSGMSSAGQATGLTLTAASTNTMNLQSQERVFLIGAQLRTGNNSLGLTFSPWNSLFAEVAEAAGTAQRSAWQGALKYQSPSLHNREGL